MNDLIFPSLHNAIMLADMNFVMYHNLHISYKIFMYSKAVHIDQKLSFKIENPLNHYRQVDGYLIVIFATYSCCHPCF